MSGARRLLPLVLFAAAVGVAGFRHAPSAPPFFPAPTQHVLREDAEKENERKREAWIESLHWAAPGTDWRAIEEANRAELVLERQARIEGGTRTDDWTEVGSANLAGRTHAAAVGPDGTTLYVGSDWGGLWRGTIDGQNWQPLSDDVGKGSHGVLVVPGTPEVLITINNGGACHVSTDAGATWGVPDGFPQYSYECTRILRDLGSPRTVYALVRGAVYDNGWIGGWWICRSEDGGLHFTVVHGQTGYSPRCDLWIDRVGDGPLYFMRGQTLWASNDHGSNFTTVGSAPVTADAVILAGSEAGNPTFYAALRVQGAWKLYRSYDAGVSWTYRFPISDFWETLCASITNANLVFFAGVECFRSTTGGVSFAKVNNWWDYYDNPLHKLHADHPGGECMMVNGQETFFLDTDGGTYVSTDGLATVTNVSMYGLGISQYYSTLTSSTDPYLIAAGAQDQGYQVSTPDQGTPYTSFVQVISGDYGHLTSTDRRLDYVYSVYPGFVLVQVSEEDPGQLWTLDFPSGASYSWLPFILADPLDPGIFYFCADHLWRYEHQGGGVYAMTQMPQSFTPGFLTGLAISAVDPSYRYAVTNQGKLWYSHDGGQSWLLSASNGPGAHYFYGTAIIVSPADPLTAYVGGSGYSGSGVYKTTDGGVNWTAMGSGLPSTLVFGLAIDDATHLNLVAATEAGPYRFDADTQSWAGILGTEAPLTGYWCVESVPELRVARFGTYGRGIWDYKFQDPAAVAGGAGAGGAGLALTIAPNPARDRAAARFDLAKTGRVRAELIDVNGRRLARLIDRELAAGPQRIDFDLAAEGAGPLLSGTYFVRVQTPGAVEVEKIQVVR
jgi:photosystem II stability/assembly factor-like uncharacterized protein